jgi:WD40 repeat protein
MDIEWCPYISTVFASVAKDGRLELWDLDNNIMDATISLKPKEDEIWNSKNVIKFSKENPVIFTGNSVGELDVYRLFGYDDYSRDKE